jgi:hypothetical protein
MAELPNYRTWKQDIVSQVSKMYGCSLHSLSNYWRLVLAVGATVFFNVCECSE